MHKIPEFQSNIPSENIHFVQFEHSFDKPETHNGLDSDFGMIHVTDFVGAVMKLVCNSIMRVPGLDK